MDRKIKDRKKAEMRIVIIIIAMILLFSGVSLAKAFSKTKIETKAEIAEPILKIEWNPAIDITTSEEKKNYTFKVKNYDETGKITQVDLEYYVKIIPDTDEIIYLKIYKNEEELKIDSNRTEYFPLEKEKEQEDNYKIEILFNKSYLVEEMKQEIEIEICARQKDNK
ncbi:MAG: hypothetical protein ACI4VH_01020 [Clostridia bacterium]